MYRFAIDTISSRRYIDLVNDKCKNVIADYTVGHRMLLELRSIIQLD